MKHPLRRRLGRLWTRLAPPLALLLAIGGLYWVALESGLEPRWAGTAGTTDALPPPLPAAQRRAPSADEGEGSTARREPQPVPDANPPVPRTRGVRLDFETSPAGQPACANCPLDGQFADLGIRFSFRSWTADATRAHWLDGSRYLPAGQSGVHGVAGAVTASGMEVGVVGVDFSDPVPRVAFRLFGPEVVERFRVTAYGPSGPVADSLVRREGPRRYSAWSGGRFRSERVTIEVPGGIQRIELDGFGPPGHVLFLDDLEF